MINTRKAAKIAINKTRVIIEKQCFIHTAPLPLFDDTDHLHHLFTPNKCPKYIAIFSIAQQNKIVNFFVRWALFL